MSTKSVIKFDDSSLTAFLSFAGRFAPSSSGQYVSLGMAEFAAIIQKAMTQIPAEVVGTLAAPATGLVDLVTAAAGGRGGVDDSALLTLKVDATGGVERVYGPAMFAAEDGRTTVIRIGKNIYPVAQTDTTVSVGTLSGRLRFSTSSNGFEDRLRVNAIFKDADDQSFEVSVVLAEGSEYTQDEIEDGLSSGEPLATYLRPVVAGGKFVKLGDLEPGMYQIAAIVESAKPEFGRFKIELIDGKVVSLNQFLKTRIDGLANAGMDAAGLTSYYAGKFLWIISKEVKGSKSYVTCQICDGDGDTAPALNPAATPKPGLPPAPTAAKPALDPRIASILARASGGPANAAVSPKPTAADPLTADKYDDIPF